jgi:hypothetical protein
MQIQREAIVRKRRFFTNVLSSTLTWTQTDTLIPGVVTVVQVYRNGQILLPSQYTIPTSTSVVIAATSFKVGDNYTVIFPRGGGAGSGGGSGSLTSISAGTGIVVSPNPITTTGTVSADLTVMMELTDTTLLNLTTRFASKLNTTDTASLSSRIDAKGNGTVTSVATGYGLSGGTITTTGTLVLDSAVVFSQIRDSIVDVAIGNDTIKILKQEYAPATTSVLTWTITPKFPIQLKQYILVFRNGQLLINDQYNLTDTNQITIVSNSFKIGANYTVVTVSGIGSVGTGVFPNPVYPDAGIALSTGTTWASSIPNNSTNWNTAFTDRLKWDGGSTGLVAATGRTSLGGTTIGQSMFTLTNPSAITFPRFNADNTVTARTAANFRSDIGAGTVTSVTASGTAGNPISITNTTTTPVIELLSATTGRNGYLTSTDWTTFNNKQNALSNASASVSGILTSTDWTTFNGKQTALNGTGFVKASGTTITYDNSTYLTTSSASTTYLAKTDTAAMLLPYFRDADTTLLNLTSRFASKLNISDTAAMLSNYNTRINSKLNISDTLSMLTPYFRDADTTLLNLTSRFASKLNISDTAAMLSNYNTRINSKLNISDTLSMLTPYFRDADTTLLNLTSRFASKLNISDTAAMLSNYNTRINSKLNISDTLSMLTPYFRDADTTLLNLTSRFASKLNISDTAAMLSNYNTRINSKLNISDTLSMLTPYFKDADTTLLNLTSRFAAKQNNITLTTTGTSGAATLVGATLNIPQYTGGSGTVTNVSGTGAISVATGTTTPVISVADAAFGTAGIVTSSGTQQFSGDKVFEGITQFNGRALFKNYTYVATRLAGLSSTDRFATVTIGSGLSLSSGTLSATGGGVTSVTASSPLSSSGGATPNITITDAGAAASGVVNTTTQSFAGNKTFTGTLDVSSTGTFGGRVKTNWLERNYAYSTSSSFTVSVNTTWQDINTSVLTTITLPNAATYPGKELHLRQTGAGSVQSASFNIIPFLVAPTGSTSNGILIPSGDVRAATLVSDGDNWIIMQRNN